MTNKKSGRFDLFRQFVGPDQRQALYEVMQGEERSYFREKVATLITLFETMPRTYEQNGKGDQAIAYLHYFTAGADWYITEKDAETSEEPGQHQAFGLADLSGDGGELGYISIVELLKNRVELDLYWTPKTLQEVRNKAERAKRSP